MPQTSKRASGTPSTLPMQEMIYLMVDEMKLFSALPPALQDGWKVQEETQSYADSDRKRQVRLEMLRLSSPNLRAIADMTKGAATTEEFMALAEKIDLGQMSEKDMGSTLFALGPDIVTGLLHESLKTAKTDEDVQTAAALSQLRHISLDALLSTSVS